MMFRRKAKKCSYDRENQKPVIRSSICTGEQVAGFKNIHTSEYRHWEQTHCYLLMGKERALLIDTGLGICNIREPVRRLTDKPVAAAATHVHWDHIGGHRYFPEFYVHPEERSWLCGGFPLPVQAVRSMVADRCELPGDFDVSSYEIFQGEPTGVLRDGDCVDLGGRVLQALPASRIFPGHHSLDIRPEIAGRMRAAFQDLNAQGKLRHGSGTFDFGDWAVAL